MDKLKPCCWKNFRLGRTGKCIYCGPEGIGDVEYEN